MANLLNLPIYISLTLKQMQLLFKSVRKSVIQSSNSFNSVACANCIAYIKAFAPAISIPISICCVGRKTCSMTFTLKIIGSTFKGLLLSSLLSLPVYRQFDRTCNNVISYFLIAKCSRPKHNTTKLSTNSIANSYTLLYRTLCTYIYLNILYIMLFKLFHEIVQVNTRNISNLALRK